MTAMTTIYPLAAAHQRFCPERHTIQTALRHYLADLRAVAHGDYYRQRPPHDFGRSMHRRVLASEIWAVRRALRGMRDAA